jgi:hypothetical protein
MKHIVVIAICDAEENRPFYLWQWAWLRVVIEVRRNQSINRDDTIDFRRSREIKPSFGLIGNPTKR